MLQTFMATITLTALVLAAVLLTSFVLIEMRTSSAKIARAACQNAASYNLYRGAAHGGPYTKMASGIVSTTYNDAQVTHSQTLYYVTTAVNGSNESGYSNEVSVVIP